MATFFFKGEIHLNSLYFILVTCAGAACSALQELQQGVYLVGVLEPARVSSTSNSPLVLAAASSDTLYQMTDNINALIQQQLSGRGLNPARRGASWATGTYIPSDKKSILCIDALFKQVQSQELNPKFLLLCPTGVSPATYAIIFAAGLLTSLSPCTLECAALSRWGTSAAMPLKEARLAPQGPS